MSVYSQKSFIMKMKGMEKMHYTQFTEEKIVLGFLTIAP